MCFVFGKTMRLFCSPPSPRHCPENPGLVGWIPGLAPASHHTPPCPYPQEETLSPRCLQLHSLNQSLTPDGLDSLFEMALLLIPHLLFMCLFEDCVPFYVFSLSIGNCFNLKLMLLANQTSASHMHTSTLCCI